MRPTITTSPRERTTPNLRLSLFLVTAILGVSGGVLAADPKIERGEYLVTLGSCNDCHTPGYFFGNPDLSRALSGSDVGFGIPGVGAFVGGNLTPDKETGLGDWTDDQIISALTAGIRPDGRRLATIMPWQGLSHLSSDDAHAIVAYLRSLPPVKRAVPGPFGPNEVPTIPVFVIVPGAVYGKLPAPQ
jgi:mono/diheme cytochrome c family protein